MTGLTFACLVYILSAQPIVYISTIPGPVTEFRTVGGQTHRYDYNVYGWAECTSGHVDRLVATGARVLEEEALHGVDCADDGRINGSPLPYPSLSRDPAHEWTDWAQADPARAVERIKELT